MLEGLADLVLAGIIALIVYAALRTAGIVR